MLAAESYSSSGLVQAEVAAVADPGDEPLVFGLWSTVAVARNSFQLRPVENGQAAPPRLDDLGSFQDLDGQRDAGAADAA